MSESRWTWKGARPIHGGSSCTGRIYHYAYRYYQPSDGTSYERCIGLWWCSLCRETDSQLIHIPRERVLRDLLAEAPEPIRSQTQHGSRRMLEYLDRLARRGEWPLD